MRACVIFTSAISSCPSDLRGPATRPAGRTVQGCDDLSVCCDQRIMTLESISARCCVWSPLSSLTPEPSRSNRHVISAGGERSQKDSGYLCTRSAASSTSVVPRATVERTTSSARSTATTEPTYQNPSNILRSRPLDRYIRPAACLRICRSRIVEDPYSRIQHVLPLDC